MVRKGLLVSWFALLATVTLVPLPAAAQQKAAPPLRTPDGKPNLEGIYSFSTITPLQRPETFAGKSTLTDQEAAEFEASENTRLNRDGYRDSRRRGPDPFRARPRAQRRARYRGRSSIGPLSRPSGHRPRCRTGWCARA